MAETPIEVEAEEFNNFFNDFMEESDRAAIILGAAQIDELLRKVIEKKLVGSTEKLFDFNGPMGTFSSKIDMAYALGTINLDFSKKIHLVRKIRNDCAHNIAKVNFKENSVSQKINELSASYNKTEFWKNSFERAKNRFKKDDQSMALRLSISLIVANLIMIEKDVSKIDGKKAQAIFVPASSIK